MKTTYLISDVQITYTRTDLPTVKIISSSDALKPCLDTIPPGQIALREFFGVLLLNRANKVLRRCILSTGSISSTVVDVRHLMQYVILSNATGIVLFHNHPSGNIRPSTQDCSITQKIKNACGMFEVVLVDHIILSGYPDEQPNYFSFADAGMV